MNGYGEGFNLGKASTVKEAKEITKTARPKFNVKPQMKESLKRIFPNAYEI